MKTKIFAAFAGVVVVAAGCVSTVDERHEAGVPFIRDQVEGRYERPVDQVYDAAKQVLVFNGTLVRDSTLATNNVRVLEGKANQCSVWIRIELIDPKPITSVIVQGKNSGSGPSSGNLVRSSPPEICDSDCSATSSGISDCRQS